MTKVLTDSRHYSDIASQIRAKNGSSDTYTPGEMAAAIAAIPTGYTPPTFAEATDDEMSAAVYLHRIGVIDLTQYWHVGDVREVPITLYKATVTDYAGVDVTMPGSSSNPGKWRDAVDNTWKDIGDGVPLTTHWVLADVNDGASSATYGYNSAAAFTAHQIEAVQHAMLGSTDTFTACCWDICTLRRYLNGSYQVDGIKGYYDGLPPAFRSLLLPASVVTADITASAAVTSTDKLFIPAETECLGKVGYANPATESSLVQWEHFTVSENRRHYRLRSDGYRLDSSGIVLRSVSSNGYGTFSGLMSSSGGFNSPTPPNNHQPFAPAACF